MVDRRKFLKGASIATTIGMTGLSGCLGGGGGNDDDTDTDDGNGDDTSTPQPFGDGTLDFYMSPSEPQDLMTSQYAPVEEHLTSEVQDTELTYAKNYTAVLEAMGSGTGDVAETGPFAAALGVNEDRADIILQRFAYGSWKYTSVIATKSDSDISSLSDLKGKTVAFADRLSASGSLFPLYMLKQAGLSIGDLPTGGGASADFEPTYAGGHAQAFEALNAGQVDAAGVGQFITLTENDAGERVTKDGFEYVKTYDGIPRAPIVVSPELSDEEKASVTDAFVNGPDSLYLGEDGEEGTDDDLWFSDVRKAGVDTYQPVIDVATDLGISLDQLDN